MKPNIDSVLLLFVLLLFGLLFCYCFVIVRDVVDAAATVDDGDDAVVVRVVVAFEKCVFVVAYLH